MKYNVNIAVVSRAKAGNRVTDNKPTAEAALTTGSTWANADRNVQVVE